MSTLSRCMLVIVLLVLLVSAAPALQASPAADASVWSAEYFNNVDVAGPPALLRGDADINFFWPEYTSPAPGYVNASNYSIRWTRQLYFNASGNWVFTTVNDDGMRAWVDNALVVDAWYDQGPTTHTGTVNVAAGWHVVKVEYYNRTLGGTARFSYALQGTATYSNWKGEYFNNQSLSGGPVVTRNDTDIRFNWISGSPDPAIPADHFSVRWTRTFYLDAGTWRFTTTTDDGVRLWVDGALVIDRWIDQGVTSYAVDVPLAAGNHAVQMEYFENGGNAFAQLTYAIAGSAPPPTTVPPPPGGGAWHGQYYNNISLSGNPVFLRDDSSVHFDWGAGSPDWRVPPDYFSAKWDSSQWINTTGNYTVLVSSDDGIRVWIDGGLVIDAWYDHAPALFSSVRNLTAGWHSVHVEYYERTGGAMVGVDIGAGYVPPPPPTGDIIVDDRSSGWQAGGSSSAWRNSGAGYGGHAFWTMNNTYAAANYNWARWYPGLPHAGYYEVSAYIPSGVATTANARYWIYHNNRYDLITRAQGFYGNQWMSLGTYYFNAAGGENVSLSDVTYECFLCRTLVYDAVKFTPR